MAEKQPADNFAARVKGDDNFSAKGIKRTTQERPLILRGDVGEVGARNEVPMQFEPADQWIALVILDLVSFWQTAQPGTQAIAIALPNARKNSNPSHAGCVCHCFNDAGKQSFDLIQASEDTRETQQRQRWRVCAL